MTTVDLVIDRLSTVATPDVVIRDAAIAVSDGRIAAIGPREEVLRAVDTGKAELVDGSGRSAIPGLVDCHTHTVWAGSRIDEFDRRAQGQTYEEIAAAGGGIRATVAAVRDAGEAELTALATERLARMRALGSTTVEVKSGYGLDPHSEATMLRAAHASGAAAGVRVTGTCLALHALPPDAGSQEEYVRLAIEEILAACAGLADAADCFLERGAFSADECRPYLEAARAHGLRLRIHGDQFSECGAVPLAIELAATSVDHLEQTGADGVRALAASDVAAVCLPLCALYLDLPMPPARALLDAGAHVALATDFNPGSAPAESMLSVLNLACTQLRLSCAEALVASTTDAARVLGLEGEVGRLEPGLAADIVLIDDPDWRAACYHLGEVPARVFGARFPA